MNEASQPSWVQRAFDCAPGWLQTVWRWDRTLSYADEGIVVAAMLGCAFLASASAVTRWLDVAGSPWLEVLPRYLTLALGWFGASLAVRRGSHIALDVAQKFLPERWSRWATRVALVVATIVSAALAKASYSFVQFEREGGSTLLQTIPTWVPASVLALGFGLMSMRFGLRALSTSRWTAVTMVAVGVGAGYVPAEQIVWVGGGFLLLGAVAGTPLFIVLGGLALSFFAYDEIELAAVPIEIYRLSEAPTLVTLPLFTLMGAVLSAGEAPQRLVRVARAVLGFVPGGLVVATVILCAFFTTFTGASGVTILALGLLLRTLLLEEGYSEKMGVG